MTTTQASVTTQVHRVYIRATPEAIWDAITSPEWSARYGYGGRVDYDLRPGGTYKAHASEEFLAAGAPETVIDGEVLEADPPRGSCRPGACSWTPTCRPRASRG